MIRLIGVRLVESLAALIVMSAVIFLMGRTIGDPVALPLPDNATEADRAAIVADLGLDRPLTVQYLDFVGSALQGDFGQSVGAGRQDALALVLSRLPASLSLAAVALAGTLAVGIVLGVIAGVRRGGPADLIVRLLALIGQSVPSFWLGILLIWIFPVSMGWFYSGGNDTWVHYILPALTLGLFTLAGVTRLVRASMLDAMGSEYVKLARIKGVSEGRVIWSHALGNSLIPVVTFMGTFFATMITGAVVVETVFSWPGIGRLAYESILARDFPVMQCVVLVITTIFLFANLVVDVLYLAIDPRMRTRGA